MVCPFLVILQANNTIMKYIQDTEFAVKTLIDVIFNEERIIKELETKISNYVMLYEDFRSYESGEDWDDINLQDKFMKQAQFHKDQNIPKKQNELKEIKEELKNKNESINALSTAILQIAKQGISIVHGNLSKCPEGRKLGTETIKNIIWQSRNQSIHYEEIIHNTNVLDCFIKLKDEHGDKFDITNKTNKAKDIIDLLGWNCYKNYSNDMNNLLQ